MRAGPRDFDIDVDKDCSKPAAPGLSRPPGRRPSPTYLRRLARATAPLALLAFGFSNALGLTALADPARTSESRFAAVFGLDDRQPGPARNKLSYASNKRAPTVPDEPEAVVGWIETPLGHPRCSAVCLTDRHALTAGHCLEPTGPGSEPQANRFGLSRNQARRSIAITAIKRPPEELTASPPINAHHDWAIVTLKTSICRPPAADGSRPLPLVESEPERLIHSDIYQLGFHSDIQSGMRLVRSGNCAVDARAWPQLTTEARRDFEKPDTLLFHRCDGAAISSGAPVFVPSDNGSRLVALNIGTYVSTRVVIPRNSAAKRIQSTPRSNIAIRIEEILSHPAAQEVLRQGTRETPGLE